MADRLNPMYETYPYPPGHVGQHSSQYPSSVAQYPPGHGSPPQDSSSCAHTGGIYYNAYHGDITAPYAPTPPTTSVTQQYPLNNPAPTQSSHQSHSYSHSDRHPYTHPYAPPIPRPQLHSRSQSQGHGYPPQTSTQAPIALPQQEQQYLLPFAQTINISPQYPASPSRPFACDMCALSFSRAHDLRRHRETHTGEKPFPCNGGCGKTFSRKDAMRRHQLVKQCGKIEEAWP